MGTEAGAGALRLPTPATSHLTEEKFSEVYEPSEDSFLFMDALQQEADTLDSLQPVMILEMGCGSGCITSFLASLLQQLSTRKPSGPLSPIFFVVDKQLGAVEASRATMKRNNPGAQLEGFGGDLFEAFRAPSRALQSSSIKTAATDAGCAVVKGLSEKSPASDESVASGVGPFDLILFNPPYVPGSPRAVVASEDLPWWGGALGREVTDRFIEKVMDFLSPRGILYLLLERRNKPEEVVHALQTRGCAGQLVASRKIRGEVLTIWRFSRPV